MNTTRVPDWEWIRRIFFTGHETDIGQDWQLRSVEDGMGPIATNWKKYDSCYKIKKWQYYNMTIIKMKYSCKQIILRQSRKYNEWSIKRWMILVRNHSPSLRFVDASDLNSKSDHSSGDKTKSSSNLINILIGRAWFFSSSRMLCVAGIWERIKLILTVVLSKTCFWSLYF